MDNTDDQKIDKFNLNGDTLELSVEDDGEADKTVDLSKYLDNTDDQEVTTFSLDTATNVLTITLEDGNTETVDLSSLDDQRQVIDQQITGFSLACCNWWANP